MKIKAVKRFNMREPGDIFEAKKEDGKKWVGMGLAEQVKDSEKPEEKKDAKEPKKDKMVKDAPKSK